MLFLLGVGTGYRAVLGDWLVYVKLLGRQF